MDDRAALELIFLPGLTTAEQVTDISGRGVGMDVVRSNIRQLHGTTTLESKLGSGSKIIITLPASLMVSKGILVEAKGEEYVFPIESVVQIVSLPRQVEVAVASGKTTAQACKEAAITEQTYYRWRKEYGGLQVD